MTVSNLPAMKSTAAKGRLTTQEGEPFQDYLLSVSTIEPRKNHVTLLAAWENMRAEKYPHLKLVIVGMLGWDHEAS
ncbi:MAG: hypothetical protein IPP88_21625 [Betaproteobacteria bacterium]|nr:hypothetical protein [Betaproteobacteria bacterium]